jgi:septum formation protein
LFLEGDSGGRMSAPPPLVLASTSRYRRDLLGRFGVGFDTAAPGIQEDPRAGELPMDRAMRLALEKAQAVAARAPRALVIGSDQVASAGGTILDKPGDAARARAQLARLAGRSARFYTACALIGVDSGVHAVHLDTTTVHFRSLGAAEIERYVERDEPYDCAGGFKAESLGITLFERLETEDPTALIGLPLIWLSGALRAAGFELP